MRGQLCLIQAQCQENIPVELSVCRSYVKNYNRHSILWKSRYLPELSDYYQVVCPFINNGCVSAPPQEQVVTAVGARPEQIYRQLVIAVKRPAGVASFPIYCQVMSPRAAATPTTRGSGGRDPRLGVMDLICSVAL